MNIKKAFIFSFILFIGFKLFAQSDLVVPLYFKPNNYTIDKKYYSSLNNIINRCATDTIFKIKIFAYSNDSINSVVHDSISVKRGMVVYNYLTSHLIDTTKIYLEWDIGEDLLYDLHFHQSHFDPNVVDVWVRFYKR